MISEGGVKQDVYGDSDPNCCRLRCSPSNFALRAPPPNYLVLSTCRGGGSLMVCAQQRVRRLSGLIIDLDGIDDPAAVWAEVAR